MTVTVTSRVFSPVLEQVRLTTIEVLTGLTFPALLNFDPTLFDRQGRTRAMIASRARSTLRERLTRPRIERAAQDAIPNLEPELLMDATSPSTAVITSMRDIVL